jgi:GNAT superfamily N-acetyltransferase
MSGMTEPPSGSSSWTLCGPEDAALLGSMNLALSTDEGGMPVGQLSVYVERMERWLRLGQYNAALATIDEVPVAYVLWRDDPDYGDIFVRQFFVRREYRGTGLGRRLFADAVGQFWQSNPLRLDVYDSNPRGRAFWEAVGFEPYSRLMRRAPQP